LVSCSWLRWVKEHPLVGFARFLVVVWYDLTFCHAFLCLESFFCIILCKRLYSFFRKSRVLFRHFSWKIFNLKLQNSILICMNFKHKQVQFHVVSAFHHLLHVFLYLTLKFNVLAKRVEMGSTYYFTQLYLIASSTKQLEFTLTVNSPI